MLNAVVRYGPRAGLMGAAQGRLEELWAAAGCRLSAFAPAPAPEPEAQALRLSAVGLALMGAQQSPGGLAVRRTREEFSNPLGVGLGGKAGTMVEEACVKRRRQEGNPGATAPYSQGLLQDSTGAKEKDCAGSRGNLRSSALGQALLFGVRGKGRLAGAESLALAGCRSQGAPGTLVSSSMSGQLSRLGEAVNAEDRRELKRGRLCGDPGQVQPCSPGALDAIAACRDVEVASAVAAWPRGPRDQAGSRGSSSSGPAGPC
jgi:hypothetical protein